MPYHCMGHRCNACGSVYAFDMSDLNRHELAMSSQQCGCSNIQYYPREEMCQGRFLATCPSCMPDHWETNDLLSRLRHNRLDTSGVQFYVPPSDRAFIGPRYQAPEPCMCQACDR